MDHLIKPEWSTLKRLMFMKAASGGSLNEYEIIGNPAVFQTNVAKPLSGFTIPFLPVQQGTGDLSPDNVRPITGWSGAKFTRSGKNMFLYNADNVKQNNAVSGSTQLGTRAVYHTGIFADGQTTFSLSAYRKNADAPTGRNLNYGWFIGGVASSKGYFIKETEEVEVNTNPSAGAEIVLITTNDNVSTMQSNIQKYNIQIEVGSSASPYAEYTGASYPVTFPATGKNLCSLGDKTVTRSQKFSLGATLQPGTYTLSIVATSTDTDDNRCLVSIWDGETVVATHDFPRNERHSWTFTAQSEFNAIYLYASDSWGHGEGDTATFTDVMLNTGSTALPYEPFTNTVYGGTLDAVTGVLSVERCHVKVKWGEFVHDATYENTKRGHKTIPYNCLYGASGRDGKTLCDKMPYIYNNNDEIHFYLTDTDRIRAFVPISTEDTDEFDFVCTLAEPIEIQLDPLTISTLIGDNTIWTDTNGENTVRYKKKG